MIFAFFQQRIICSEITQNKLEIGTKVTSVFYADTFTLTCKLFKGSIKDSLDLPDFYPLELCTEKSRCP